MQSMIRKGDKVRLSNGTTGEIVDIWGLARTSIRVRNEEGKTQPYFETDIVEVISTNVSSNEKRRRR